MASLSPAAMRSTKISSDEYSPGVAAIAGDAAYILSIPRATVKTRMFYARKKLAELVNEI
jgi:hypothetical protein